MYHSTGISSYIGCTGVRCSNADTTHISTTVINFVFDRARNAGLRHLRGCNTIRTSARNGSAGKNGATVRVTNVYNFTANGTAGGVYGSVTCYSGCNGVASGSTHSSNVITTTGACAQVGSYIGRNGRLGAYNAANHLNGVAYVANAKYSVASYVGGNGLISANNTHYNNLLDLTGRTAGSFDNYTGCNRVIASSTGHNIFFNCDTCTAG